MATLEQMLAKLIAVPIGSELPISASGVGNWVLRPHEILEDALRDTLTGNDDDGSGTSMASIVADVSADRALLTTLTPLLNELSPGLVTRATGQLDAIDQAGRRDAGQWRLGRAGHDPDAPARARRRGRRRGA